MVVDGKALVFEYFFQIGAGLATGIGLVTLLCYTVYKLIDQRLGSKQTRKKERQGLHV